MDDRLYPNLYGNRAYFYKEPNLALTRFLVGFPLQVIVAEWTAKVVATYITALNARPGSTGNMASHVNPEVFIGGYNHDRWIGQITVEVEYAAADEFGRSEYAEYEGSHDLRNSLYMHLPAI